MSEQSNEVASQTKKGALARLLASIKGLVDPQFPVEDRRVAGRYPCSLATTYVTENGDTGAAELIDVSRRGVQLKGAAPLARGVTVALKPPKGLSGQADFAPIMAKVMWTTRTEDGFLAGLLLPPGAENEETWLEALLVSLGHSPNYGQRRKFVRADSELEGRLLLDAQTPVDVTVLNLGLGGALVRAAHSIEKNSPFRLQLGPHGDLPEIELSGTILRANLVEGADVYLHSTRFGPLERRRHSLLKEYIIRLLKKG